MDHRLRMSQGVTSIEQLVNLRRGEEFLDIRVAPHFGGKGSAMLPDFHGVALHPGVRLLTGDAFAYKREQHMLG